MKNLLEQALNELNINYTKKDDTYTFTTTYHYKENEETKNGIKFLSKKKQEIVEIEFTPNHLSMSGSDRGLGMPYSRIDKEMIKRMLQNFLVDNEWSKKEYEQLTLF